MKIKPLDIKFPTPRFIEPTEFLIRFDMCSALKQGVTDHPQKVVEDLGMIVLSFEGVPIADCAIMDVAYYPKQIPTLPSYIEIITE